MTELWHDLDKRTRRYWYAVAVLFVLWLLIPHTTWFGGSVLGNGQTLTPDATRAWCSTVVAYDSPYGQTATTCAQNQDLLDFNGLICLAWVGLGIWAGVRTYKVHAATKGE